MPPAVVGLSKCNLSVLTSIEHTSETNIRILLHGEGSLHTQNHRQVRINQHQGDSPVSAAASRACRAGRRWKRSVSGVGCVATLVEASTVEQEVCYGLLMFLYHGHEGRGSSLVGDGRGPACYCLQVRRLMVRRSQITKQLLVCIKEPN